MSSFRSSSNELDELFFGSISVYLTEVEGEVEVFPPKHGWADPPPVDDSEWHAAVSEAASMGEPLTSLGTEYSNVVQPCIVAIPCAANKEDLKRTKPNDDEESDNPLAKPVLLKPLLKCPRENAPPSCKVGVASGVRSAILKVDEGKWLRLKGCGNYDQGFPAEPVGVLPCGAPALSVRGSCFESTVNREACMTALVASLLEPHGVPIGNRSVAAFHYQTPSSKSSSGSGAQETSWPLWPFEKVTRHCGVFETLGDKRAGDHLLGGVEALLHHLMPMQQKDIDTFSRLVNSRRGLPADSELMTTDMLPYAADPPPPPAAFLDMPEMPKHATPPKASDMPDILAAYHQLWDEEVTVLGRYLETEDEIETSIVMALAWRIGWECGRVQNILIDSEVSWGTYPDALGTHCNAHANNMVVLTLETSTAHNCLLAPVDLDMAFHRSAYIQPLAAQYRGFDSDWEDLTALEREGFSATLAGSDFISTGVGNVSNSLDPRRVAFRDTVCAAFRAGLTGSADEYASATVGTPLRHRACAALIRMALIITHKVQT